MSVPGTLIITVYCFEDFFVQLVKEKKQESKTTIGNDFGYKVSKLHSTR